MRVLVHGPVHGVAAPHAEVLVEEGHIRWVGRGKPPADVDLDITAEPEELIAAGFIDLQVNGFGGYDASSGSEGISAISELLPRYGVTGFLPSAISCPLDSALDFVRAAGAATPRGARILGVHLEGPFLSPAFPGAHDPGALLEPTPERIDRLLTCPPRMITVAPELPGGLEAVARLSAAGVVVAAGHSGADWEQGRQAIEAGVRFGTHLYNAMRGFHHRRPGLAGALLFDERATVGLIADGEHLHDATCEQVALLKPPRKIALTTDQTAAAGAPHGRYSLGGRTIVSDGRAARLEDGTLAGSVATMDQLVRRMAQLPRTSLRQAVTMATAAPAAVLRDGRLGRVRAGGDADLVILDKEMRVRLTMVGGRVVFQR